MAEVEALADEDTAFLRPYLPPPHRHPHVSTPSQHSSCSQGGDTGPDTTSAHPERPFVTLTYACSLDGMISLAPGVRTTLSGAETKAATHFLRLEHDAILVGVGTALADDPGLNCRYPGVTLDRQPQPVILDPKARWNVVDSKARRLADSGAGKAPWIVVHADRHPHAARDLQTAAAVRIPVNDNDSSSRTQQLQQTTHVNAAATAAAANNRLDWRAILTSLKRRGIASIMIEGGATIINDLLLQPGLVDSVIITIAPTYLGQGGVAVAPAAQRQDDGRRVNAARLGQTAWRQFGQDAILCGRLL